MPIKNEGAPLQSLEDLLSPVDPAYFLREIYGHEPLHIPGAANKFSHLLSWDGLNKATSVWRKNFPPLRLAKDGKILSQQQFSSRETNANGEFWSINFRMVRQLLEEGATLVVDRMDQTHEPLADYCRMFEAELGSDAFADVFASWRQTPGFPTHWDPEQGFVAQLIGTKHWRVFKPERLHPMAKDKSRNDSPPAQPYWEGDMNPGDLLYIPGGWWHDALAVSARTLHVAVGLFPATGLTVMNAILKDISEDERVRAPLPRFASESEQQDYMSHLRSAVDTKLRGLTVKSVLNSLDARARVRTRLSMPWSAVPETEAIPANAWIHWLPSRRPTVKEIGTEITFEAIGVRFSFAVVGLPVIQDLISRRKSPFRELCSRHPQLPVEKILLGLVSVGLVAIADEPAI